MVFWLCRKIGLSLKLIPRNEEHVSAVCGDTMTRSAVLRNGEQNNKESQG